MAELLEAAYQHCLNTRSYDPNGVIPRDAFGELWRAIGEYIAEQLGKGRGVQLPRLGTISLLKLDSNCRTRAPEDDSATHDGKIFLRTPIFLVDQKFASEHNITRFDPKPVQYMIRNHPYSWAGEGQHNAVGPAHQLNFATLSGVCGQSRERIRRMYDIIIRCVSESINGEFSDVLTIPPLGELQCGQGSLELLFNDAFCQQIDVKPPDLSPRQRLAPRQRTGPLLTEHVESATMTPPLSRSSSRSSRLSDYSILREAPEVQFSEDALAQRGCDSSVQMSTPDRQPYVPSPKSISGPKPAGLKAMTEETSSMIIGDQHAVPLPEWWLDMQEKIAAKSNNARKLFRHFDADKSGSVDRDEFIQGLRNINVNLSPKHLDELMKIVDEDGMGDVDYNEFARKLASSDGTGLFQSRQQPTTSRAALAQTAVSSLEQKEKPSTIVAENRPKLADEQRDKTHRLCRVLDVFSVLDESGSGLIKDFDLVLGINKQFDIHLSKDEGRELVYFLSKGAEDGAVSRVDFARAYVSWERLCSIDDQKKGIRDFIAMVPMFHKLADPQYFGGSLAEPRKIVKMLAQMMKKMVVAPRTVIIRKGEVGNEMFFLISGRAEIMVRSLSDPPVAEKEPGSFFGESALLNSEPRNAYVRAKTECVLYVLSKDDLDNVLKGYPELRDVIRPPTEGLRNGRGHKHGPLSRKNKTTRRRSQKLTQLSTGVDVKALKTSEVSKLTLLKNVPLFQAMPDTFGVKAHVMDDFIKNLLPLLKRVELPKGRYIVREGEFGDAMFFIADGRLEVVSGVEDKPEVMLHKGNCFGELALLFRERRTKSVRSASSVVIYRLSANDFQACLQKHPDVNDNLLYMAEQRRLQVVRGGHVPDVFARTARVICDDMIPVAPSEVLGIAHPATVPAWQLRTLLGEILPLWPVDAVDWLLAGGPEPQYTLNAHDRLLPIEYNRVLLPKSIQRRRQSSQRKKSNTDMEVWGDWKRLYSKKSQKHYFWHVPTKTSHWEAPGGSPWVHREAESPDSIFEEEHPRTESPRRPKWWNSMVQTIESKTTNVRQTFRKFDADCSGTVDYEECYSGLKSLGVFLDDVEFEELLSIIDADGSGEISYFEFAEMLAATEKPNRRTQRKSRPRPVYSDEKERRLPAWWKEMRVKIEAKATNVRTLFRMFDTDKSGTVDVQEFRNGLHYINVELSDAQFAELLDMVDTDGGGQIDYIEFAENLARIDDQYYGGWFSGDSQDEKHAHRTFESETFAKLRRWVERNSMDWETAFRHFRKARSGEMNSEDFERAIRCVNSKLSSQQVAELMRCVDRDGGGSISLEEWMYHFDDRARSPDWENDAFRRLQEALTASSLTLGDLVRRADTSGDGTLSVGELARAIMGVGFSKEEATDLAHTTDVEQTGNVVVRVLQKKLAGTDDQEEDWQDRVLNSVRAKLLAKQTPQEIAVAFSKFDFDGDGSISRSELGRGMNMLGIKLKASEIDHLMDVCDDDGNGELDFNEFVTKILNQQPLSVDEVKHVKRKIQLAVFDMETTFKTLFDKWNVTRSGFLSLAQFTRGLESLPAVADSTSREIIKGIFVSADQDGDGYLSYSEFAKFFEETKQKVKSAAVSQSAFVQAKNTKSSRSLQSTRTGTASTKALQNLRDRIFHRKVSLMEVFHSFDDDYDGFISSDEFLQGLSGKSKSVAACLGDLRDLGLSYQDVLDLYHQMDSAGHGFVNYDAFCAFLDENLPPNWEEQIVDEMQKHLHKQGLTSEELFEQWNSRHDGALDIGYFSRGLKSIGVMKGSLTDSMCQAFFNTMDKDHDGLITIREFNEQFSFRVARFDWKQNALQIITRLLAGTHKTPVEAFVAFQNRSMRKSMRPMNSLNFQRYFDGVDAVLALRLKKWEWRELFLSVDRDMDGRIGEEDFVNMLKEYHETGRVTNENEHEEALSSADVFRRADKDCDGFLDHTEFVSAAQMVRPGATLSEIERGWVTVGGRKTGRVDLNGFARYIAEPTEKSWQMHAMEQVRDILKNKRALMRNVFTTIDRSGTGVLSSNEFREAMNRLGLALSKRNCDTLHRRIDVNCSGGITMEDVIGWATGSFVEGPLSDRAHVIELAQLHLGSAENFFVWIQKKFKLKSEMYVKAKDFARGIKALYQFSPVKHAQAKLERYDTDLEEAICEMFAKAGGRDGVLTFANFLEYYTEEGHRTVETTLPPVVTFLSQHRKEMNNELGKALRSKDKLSGSHRVAWLDFQRLLLATRGESETGVDWNEHFWVDVRKLADPQNTGWVEYKPFLNRCHFRADMVSSRNSRKTGRLARTKLPRASAIAERLKH